MGFVYQTKGAIAKRIAPNGEDILTSAQYAASRYCALIRMSLTALELGNKQPPFAKGGQGGLS